MKDDNQKLMEEFAAAVVLSNEDPRLLELARTVLEETQLDEESGSTFFDIIDAKSSKEGARFESLFKSIDRNQATDHLLSPDYDRLVKMFFIAKPDKEAAKNLLIRLISKHADDGKLCSILTSMAHMAKIPGV